MCGIVGVFENRGSIGSIGNNRRKAASELVKKGLKAIQYRGRDGQGIFCKGSYAIGHCLHSVVGRVKQPLICSNDSAFAANCEIYNWLELNKRYGLSAKNDAELMLRLFELKGVDDKVLAELDGVYAFCYLKDGRLYLARDIIGQKPLWYSHMQGLMFASEKKALEKIGAQNISELNPRHILTYDVEKDHLEISERPFFNLAAGDGTGIVQEETTDEKSIEDIEYIEDIEKETETLIRCAIAKRIPDKKYGLLFSGGIDSTIIAFILKEMGQDFTCYTTVIDDPNLKEPEDLIYSKRVADALGLKLKVIMIKPGKISSLLKRIVPLIEDPNTVKAEVALTFFSACKAAKKDGCSVIFSGLGSEEIFAGYERHRNAKEINRECVSGLLQLHNRDLYRDDVITMYNGLEARMPYLDIELVFAALKIPGRYKIAEGVEKYILRRVAGNMGLSEGFFSRKKKAAQYGSNISKETEKLTKKSGYSYKSEYIKSFYPRQKLRLGALVSSGKDSIYAIYAMMQQNYPVCCMISMKSDNPDSYMFHTPTIELASLQSKAIGIPLITGRTDGKKESELECLKKTIAKAKEKYRLDGIITGALYSNYQRERIEIICKSLSLKAFSPLWHSNQEFLLREMLAKGFRFIMTKVACDGLDTSWLGKEITEKEINSLAALEKKIRINVAGEGGEYESLMIDGPIFKQKITVTGCQTTEGDAGSATLSIKKAMLV
ncbi:diphthine--ammonia ligase [Candidatus Woesearchaeota archaeon]|nr:diphthine--ammonia ligase [Candidatus Woesearchaeota archaeon]